LFLLEGDLNRSKYGNKFSGQNALFDKAEKSAQGIAADQAKKKVGESFDKSTNDVKNKSESKPPLPARNNSGGVLSDLDNKLSSMSRPPLPARNSDIKIPRRPTSHNNPFSGKKILLCNGNSLDSLIFEEKENRIIR
jgi:hypothetical protein